MDQSAAALKRRPARREPGPRRARRRRHQPRIPRPSHLSNSSGEIDMSKSWKLAGLIAPAALVSACKTTGTDTAPATASDAGTSVSTGTTGSGTTGGSGSIPALVSVNLQNVLNDLSVSL